MGGTIQTRAGTPLVAMLGASSQARQPIMYPMREASKSRLFFGCLSLLVEREEASSVSRKTSSSKRLRKEARIEGKTASPSPSAP
eukprot:CAMPEP_0194185346 /NCGR_PEP_ID=MMETSP0154-20130528/42335_1 /TAXON_ID=1049557 /ORGANISM="Thalassiothrix antarctica, Strain L6-D1" /LENGTH=84 /DNA_ID=CAMNT_0038903637 /DNA_START=107 /DNA_END=357 /DNA_ORIENTATION=+